MPSSLIFTGLVVLWLLILVPAVARHQQEVARPSGAALEGRVLSRHRQVRRNQGRRTGPPLTDEGDPVDPDRMDQDDPAQPGPWVSAARAARRDVAETDQTNEFTETDGTDETDDDVEPEVELDDAADDPDEEPGVRWERPPPRYRPGRGGFDPEEDAEKARARYAFRQRIVLTLLVCALLTGVAAAAAFPVVWWAHGAIDLALVVYLVYLRRQVRIEAAIRASRAARMAGTRRTLAADDRELDEWARRGREVTRRPVRPEPADAAPAPEVRDDDEDEVHVEEVDGWTDEDDDTARVRGVGEPVGLLPARRRGLDGGAQEPESALPPLQPAPPPPIPPGMSLVVVDDDDLDLHDLGTPVGAPHRRAVGQ